MAPTPEYRVNSTLKRNRIAGEDLTIFATTASKQSTDFLTCELNMEAMSLTASTRHYLAVTRQLGYSATKLRRRRMLSVLLATGTSRIFSLFISHFTRLRVMVAFVKYVS